MMRPYSVAKASSVVPLWRVLNPTGQTIATTRTWRTARKIADALNAHRDTAL